MKLKNLLYCFEVNIIEHDSDSFCGVLANAGCRMARISPTKGFSIY